MTPPGNARSELPNPPRLPRPAHVRPTYAPTAAPTCSQAGLPAAPVPDAARVAPRAAAAPRKKAAARRRRPREPRLPVRSPQVRRGSRTEGAPCRARASPPDGRKRAGRRGVHRRRSVAGQAGGDAWRRRGDCDPAPRSWASAPTTRQPARQSTRSASRSSIHAVRARDPVPAVRPAARCSTAGRRSRSRWSTPSRRPSRPRPTSSRRRNLDGGGNTDADRRAKTPLPVLPKDEPEQRGGGRHAEGRDARDGRRRS